MSTLSSASTAAEIEAAYLDNSYYEDDPSGAKAAIFIQSIRLKLASVNKKVQVGGSGGHLIETDPTLLLRLMESAMAFIRTTRGVAAGGSGVVHADTSEYMNW